MRVSDQASTALRCPLASVEVHGGHRKDQRLCDRGPAAQALRYAEDIVTELDKASYGVWWRGASVSEILFSVMDP